MKFLYPGFLWAFLVLLIPVIIHLFNFKRYKTLYFSSLSFVRSVDQRTKSTQRLKHLLVLLSRLLAFTFLVLAFAQPYFPQGGNSSATKHHVIAIYLDNSFSMESRGSEGELLSQARENVRKMIEEAPLNTQFLIGTNEMSGSEERLLSKIEALEKLDQIELSPIIRSVDEVIKWQVERLNEDDIQKEGTSIQYAILSDFQRSSGFNNQQLDVGQVEFYPIKLSPESSENVFVDSVWFTSPVHKVNGKNELNVRISNASDESLENVKVDVRIGEYKKEIYVSLPAKQQSVSQLSYMDKSPGYISGYVQVRDKEVHFDDRFYLSYEVRKEVNILILGGEDAITNVSTVYGLDDFYNTTEIEITSITKDDFENKDLIVLNGVNNLSQGVINYLTEFAATGGSLALFPGKSPEKSGWNNLLGELRLPLLGKSVSSGNKINSVNYDDPFYDGVFETETPNLNLPSVSTVFQALNNGSSLGTTLIQLQNGLPLLSYAKQEGNAFMFYSSLHSDFGNFSKNALFSSVVLKMGELSQRTQPNFIIIGDDARFPIYTKISNDSPIHVTNEQLDFIPQTTTVSGVNYLSLKMLDDVKQLTAGNYQIKTDKTIGILSLNYNRRESNLASLSEDEILDHFKSNGAQSITFNEIGKGTQVSTIDIDKPFSYWKVCIILTLIFVLSEMALVRFLK